MSIFSFRPHLVSSQNLTTMFDVNGINCNDTAQYCKLHHMFSRFER